MIKSNKTARVKTSDGMRILRDVASFLNTDVENVPNVLRRFKREIQEMEEKLK